MARPSWRMLLMLAILAPAAAANIRVGAANLPRGGRRIAIVVADGDSSILPHNGDDHLAHDVDAGHLAELVRRHEPQGEHRAEANRSSDVRRNRRVAVVAAEGEITMASDDRLTDAPDDPSSTQPSNARPATAEDALLQPVPMLDGLNTASDVSVAPSGTSLLRDVWPGLASRPSERQASFNALQPVPLQDTLVELPYSHVQHETRAGMRDSDASFKTTPAVESIAVAVNVTRQWESMTAATRPAMASRMSHATPAKATPVVSTAMPDIPLVRAQAVAGLWPVTGTALFKTKISAMQGPTTTIVPGLATVAPPLQTTTPIMAATAPATATPSPTESAPEDIFTWKNFAIFACLCFIWIFVAISISVCFMRWWAADCRSDNSSASLNKPRPSGSRQAPGSPSRKRSSLSRFVQQERNERNEQSDRSERRQSRRLSRAGVALASAKINHGKLEFAAVIEHKSESYWSGDLLKLNEDGDPHDQAGWRERQMWIGQKGLLYYWSEKDNRVSIFFDNSVVQDLIVKQLPSDYSCHPHCVSVEKHPSENPEEDPSPTYLAAKDEKMLLSFLKAINDFRKISETSARGGKH